MPSPRPTIAEINLQALQHNLHQVMRLTGAERKILAVVKADAYGHGAVEISRALEREGVRFLGVATVEEGIELRQAGIDASITVLGGAFPEQHGLLLDWKLSPVLYHLPWAEELSRTVQARGEKIAVHIKVDTGMGRLGLNPEEAQAAIPKIASLPGLSVEGVISHFADADLEDKAFTEGQLGKFLVLREHLSGIGLRIPFWHISNSAAVMDFQPALFNMVRPGIMLYGYMPSDSFPGKVELQPVLSWKTRIIHLKEVPAGTPLSYGRTFVTRRKSRIATLAVGYADGYSRSLSNRAEVLVNGRRAPVVGRVTMDMVLTDVTDIPKANLGDQATLIGEDGEDRITAWDLARWGNTIAYEVLCGIGRRVPRIYLRGEHGA
ncbi:MAG: alanine racemase [bacterium]